jgi:hypothetical protein
MNIYLVKRNVIVSQEDKSDKEKNIYICFSFTRSLFFKKRKRKRNYYYAIKVHSRDQDSVKLKINQRYCFKLTILYHNHVGLNLKVRARASGKLIDQKWKNISSKCCYWDLYY